MNYYERHLGDYAKDTAHLSMIEHGAYTLLLDRYYASETPIPADQVHRLARARTKEEREAVDAVLGEFFMLTDAGWVNRRADEEVAKAQARIESAKTNGKRGGRPKKNPSGFSEETQQEPDGFQLGSQKETQHEPSENLTKLQAPSSTSQKEKRSPEGSRLPEDWAPTADELSWARHERPDIDVVVEAAKFRDFWLAKAGKDARKANWPATFRNWIRNARVSGGLGPGRQEPERQRVQL